MRVCVIQRSILGVVLFAAVAGCNRGPQRPMSGEVPVTGVVTLDGKPLAKAEVTFTCSSPSGIFSGATDENGKYQLFSNYGASTQIQGHCSVKISKLELPPGVEPPPPTAPGAEPPPPMSPMLMGAKEVLPAKYSDGVKTTLTADVPAGGGTINFDLTSQ